MSFFREVELGPSFPPFATFRDYFGFVPQIFRAQTLLPLALEVEVALGAAVLYRRHQLSQLRKERMMLVLAAAHGSVYCLTARHQLLSLLGVPEDELEQLVRDYQQSSLPP
jgi:alkylhydroperoxidase family enzyme